jgi:hypothetical protein
MRAMLMNILISMIDIEEIKKKLQSQEKNIELLFSYLDELIEKKENPPPCKQIGLTEGD